jgi:hypothetical protein
MNLISSIPVTSLPHQLHFGHFGHICITIVGYDFVFFIIAMSSRIRVFQPMLSKFYTLDSIAHNASDQRLHPADQI